MKTVYQSTLDKACLASLVALSISVFVFRMCDVPPIEAQNEPDALLLARICVSEAGWECWDMRPRTQRTW